MFESKPTAFCQFIRLYAVKSTHMLSCAALVTTCICFPHAGMSAWQEQNGFRVPMAHGLEYLLAARVSLRRLAGQSVSSTPPVVIASTSPGTGLETVKLARKLRFKSRSSKHVSMLKLQILEMRLPAKLRRLRLVSAVKPVSVSMRLLCKSSTSSDLRACM